MTEEQKSFTVKDRRHFTADGRTREPDEERAPEAALPAPSAPALQPAPKPAPARTNAREGPTMPPSPEVDFAQFVLSLGAQAGMLLGGPVESISVQEALAEARSLIGVLEMLEDKTEGRRTPREEEVLEGLLYELRMAYVARAREAGE
jgi:hypothetical protein